jgi:hypothetical protein
MWAYAVRGSFGDGTSNTDFSRIRQPQVVREWFAPLPREVTRHGQTESRQRTDELQQQLAHLRKQQDQLLNLRLLGGDRVRYVPR